MKRRHFFGLMAAVPALAAVPSRKTGKVETVFKSPGPRPNGLQATDEGLWILDAGDNNAYLVRYEDGKLIRSVNTESEVGSGMTAEPGGLWVASTQARTILHVDAKSGKTIKSYPTPGAGITYKMAGDPPNRRSPLDPPREPGAGRAQQAPAVNPPAGDRSTLGSGANGLEWKNGLLWMAVPPARQIFCVDPATWVVQKKFDTAGNRAHGLGWEGQWLWNGDPNLNSFFRHDVSTGQILEKIQLDDKDPLPHGMTIRNGVMWYCDEVGVVCRLRIA